jgi:hypothetical protein
MEKFLDMYTVQCTVQYTLLSKLIPALYQSKINCFNGTVSRKIACEIMTGDSTMFFCCFFLLTKLSLPSLQHTSKLLDILF